MSQRTAEPAQKQQARRGLGDCARLQRRLERSGELTTEGVDDDHGATVAHKRSGNQNRQQESFHGRAPGVLMDRLIVPPLIARRQVNCGVAA